MTSRHTCKADTHARCLTAPRAVQAVVRDLYLQRDLGNFTGSFTGTVKAHGALALKVTPLRYAAQTARARRTCNEQHALYL